MVHHPGPALLTSSTDSTSSLMSMHWPLLSSQHGTRIMLPSSPGQALWASSSNNTTLQGEIRGSHQIWVPWERDEYQIA